MKNKTWIHIGFPKCASTALQRDFFARCPAFDYVGRSDNWESERSSHHGPLIALATLDELHYLPRRQEIQEQILSGFTGGANKVRVVSDELLVSTYRPYLSGIPVADTRLIAERLHEVFPDAQIIIVIRNQINFLSSMIGQLMRNNRVEFDIRTFFDAHRKHAALGYGSFLYLADYNAIYELYESVFGEGRVHVILQEELAASPQETMSRLIELMGLTTQVQSRDYLPSQHNTRTTEMELLAYRYQRFYRPIWVYIPQSVRRIIYTSLQTLTGKDRKMKIEFSEEQLAFINSFYAHGNLTLQGKIGCRLAEKGYPMEKTT